MEPFNDENAPLDYTAAPSLREGENRLRAQKRGDHAAFSHHAEPSGRVERICFPEDYGIPDNPFQTTQKPAAEAPAEEKKPDIRPSGAVSRFAAPKTLEIPDWYQTSRGNLLPPNSQKHPRVVAAESVQPQTTDALGRPVRRSFDEHGLAVSGNARNYALAGYPQDMVEEAMQQQYEEAAVLNRKSHGAQQARRRGRTHTAYPAQPAEATKAMNQLPQLEPDAAVQNIPEEPRRPVQRVRAVRPDSASPEAAKEKPRRSLLSLLPFFSVIMLFASIAFAGFSYGKGFEIQQKLNQVYAERQAAAQTLKENHPIRYRELITDKANQYKLSPAFVAAIILNESSYNPQATSSAGARGLMQLMDDTAEWIWNKLKPEGSYSFDLLYGEDLNVEFGCWYLNYLAGLFRGDPTLVAAAFHAGQNEIKNWLANEEYSSDGIHLPVDNMPDGPTKTYVRRILRDYAVYKDFYNKDEV